MGLKPSPVAGLRVPRRDARNAMEVARVPPYGCGGGLRTGYIRRIKRDGGRAVAGGARVSGVDCSRLGRRTKRMGVVPGTVHTTAKE